MKRNRNLMLCLTMLMLGISVLGTSFFSITYMTKDYNLYNIVYRFFNVSDQLRNDLTNLPISKSWLIRLLNLFFALFYTSALFFGIHFLDFFRERLKHKLLITVAVTAAVQAVVLDPAFIIEVYMKQIGPFADVIFFRRFYRVVRTFFRIYGLSLCIVTWLLLLWSLLRTPRRLKTSLALILFFFTVVMGVYFYLFNWLPVQIIWLSRIANYVSFESLPIGEPTQINAVMPYITFIAVLLLTAALIFYLLRLRNLQNYRIAFTRKINEVETMSRVFSHYLKNELLSQQAELRLLKIQVSDQLKPDVEKIITRNDQIYQHLSQIREAMKLQKTEKEEVCLDKLIQEVIDKNDPNHQLITTRITEGMMITGNREQLQAALNILISNAKEAPETNQPKKILVSTKIAQQYACISVANNGQRIDKSKWQQLFEPFYSTKPSVTNWGLGLSICQNIAMIHHGQIYIEEMQEADEIYTVFQLLISFV